MKNITLNRIDESNFTAAFQLELAEGQEIFVSHPIRSLAQAYVYYHQCTPFGIYAEDVMVGYVMVIYDPDTGEYNLWHLMIDKKHQGKGYGKLAVQACLDYIRQKPFGPGTTVLLTCHEKNVAAISLYKSLGFQETGNRDEEEIEMKLTL
ncbi:MAG: GNAT family N-acetyltransferase [Oscillospiraceae bacterium]|nr:GNAT family N-acetyltransferase [Oscillospiraceae bacterium]